MAVTIDVDALQAALRLGDSVQETTELTRLLTYATAAITKHAPDAPDAVQDEAVMRLCAYLFDKPFASRNDSYANAMRNSGAGNALLPWHKPVTNKADT